MDACLVVGTSARTSPSAGPGLLDSGVLGDEQQMLCLAEDAAKLVAGWLPSNLLYLL